MLCGTGTCRRTKLHCEVNNRNPYKELAGQGPRLLRGAGANSMEARCAAVLVVCIAAITATPLAEHGGKSQGANRKQLQEGNIKMDRL